MMFLAGFVTGILFTLIISIAAATGLYFWATHDLDDDGNKDLQS